MTVVTSSLRILFLLSQQRMICVHDLGIEDLRGRLKRAGVMRMIDCIYGTYNVPATTELSLSDLERNTCFQTAVKVESPAVTILQLVRMIESHLGMRSRTASSSRVVDLQDENDDDSAERMVVDVLLSKLVHSDRNVQLQLMDSFLELTVSDCGKGLGA